MTAALNRAQLEYDGKKTLRQQEIVSDFELSLAESDLNVAKANLAAAKAALTSARNDLGYTEIRSPSDGVVGRIPYRKGDLVGPSIQDGLTVVADGGSVGVLPYPIHQRECRLDQQQRRDHQSCPDTAQRHQFIGATLVCPRAAES